MSLKKACVAVLLLLTPIAAVIAIRRSDYGAALATPAYRQSGPTSTKVIVIEYSDFQCPACGRIQPQLREWMKTYEGKMRVYFKHYPLTNIHRNALPAAIATECAGLQKQFWPYSEKLYDRQAQWAPLMDATTHYVAIATELQMDLTQFNACRVAPDTEATVLRDAEEARSRGVNATPTFFVGDQRMVGSVFADSGARAIERAIRE